MPTRNRFVTLDGMRGIAALVVAALHIFGMFDLDLFPHANLAVDFFFVLSGFVIAHAYGERLGRSMSPLQFMKARLIRLHPLILLGSAITLVTMLARSIAEGGSELAEIGWAAIAAVLLIPYHQLPATEAFPLNGPSWSLFAEYAVNALFALIAVYLTLRRLYALLGVGIAMVLVLLSLHGTVGDVWQTDTIALSLLRVVYPFFAGVLISRLYRNGRLDFPPVPAILPIGGLLAVLMAPSSSFDPVFELAMILIGFPLLVIVGARDRCGDVTTKLMLLGGVLSYPIYMLHFPIGRAVSPLAALLFPGEWAAAGALAIMTCVIAASWGAWRYFDEPIRAWLAANAQARREARLAA